MATTPLNAQDATFLAVETADLPTHVAGLQLFRPRSADPGFVATLVERLLETPPAPLWRRRLVPGHLGAVGAVWDDRGEVDLRDHVRRVGLPAPGSTAQLERLVERLHAQRLDRRRPLWECWFVEGLEGGRFALYTKVHHALVDGVAAMTLAQRALSADPEAAPIAPWALEPPARTRRAPPDTAEQLRSTARTLLDVGRTGVRAQLDWTQRLLGAPPRADLPFAAPLTAFNGRVDGQRRFATRSLSLSRVKAIATATGTTVNDVVLALTGAALRDWLGAQQALPQASLTALCPVSVRTDDGLGNNLSALLADLATDEPDPLARLTRVAASTRRGKHGIGALSRGGAQGWALTLGLLGLVPAVLDGGRLLPPLSNLVVSNVPGPRDARWYAGAELVGYYPVSLLTHGQGLNVTVVSRGDALDFGLTGARTLVRDITGLGDALASALDRCERAVRGELDRRTGALAPRPGALGEAVPDLPRTAPHD